MGIRIRQTKTQLHPVGEYRAVIADISAAEGEFGPQCEFTFGLIDVDPDIAVIRGWATQKFSPRSKLYAWTKAARGGGLIPEDYTFDSDDLIDKEVLLTLVIRDREDGSQFNRIDLVKAAE